MVLSGLIIGGIVGLVASVVCFSIVMLIIVR